MSHPSSQDPYSSSTDPYGRRPTLPSLTQVLPEHFRTNAYHPHGQQPPPSGTMYPQSAAVAPQPAQMHGQYRQQMLGQPHPTNGGAGAIIRPASTIPAPGYVMASTARPLGASPDIPYEYGVHRVQPSGMETLRTNPRDPIHYYKPEGQEKPKPHACPLCGTMFERPSAVQIHLRTHTGEKPYECPHCHKTYPSSTNLNRHIRQVHGEEVPSSSRQVRK